MSAARVRRTNAPTGRSTTGPRRRLDNELVRRELVGSREQAKALIVAGRVTVAGAPAAKSSRLVGANEALLILGEPSRFVGRGAHKLEAALDSFGIDPEDCRALDAGASTGGFTDSMLQRGAAHVVALDVGHGQLHERLRGNDRVTVLERTNIRTTVADDIGGRVDLTVADLSFISLRRVAQVLCALTLPGGPIVTLVKPQFEAGRDEASKGRGIIRDPEIRHRVLHDVVETFGCLGATVNGLIPSPITGAGGNVEFLLGLTAPHEPDGAGPVQSVSVLSRCAATARALTGAALDACIDEAVLAGESVAS